MAMRNALEAFAGITLILSVLFACAGSGEVSSESESYRYFDIAYNAELAQVERPQDAEKRYGEYEVIERDTAQGQKYVYKDDLITAGFVLTRESILMIVENKTDFSIRIPLEEAAFVGPTGSSDRLLTGEMSYLERNDSPPPIVIPSGASASATLIPSDNVDQESISPIFTPSIIRRDTSKSTNKDTTYTDAIKNVRENIGNRFSLLIPTNIQSTVNEYNFSFSIDDFSRRENVNPTFKEKLRAILED